MSAFNGSGTYVISGTGLPFVTATTISSTVANTLNTDLATGLSTCITKDGQTTPTANIKLGGFKLTGLGAPTTSGDALSYGNIGNLAATTISGALTYGGVTLSNAVTGTGNMVLSASPTLTGSPIAPTQTASDNSTKIATTAYVDGTYQQTGSWTPADGSGAGLVFTSVSAGYTKIGKIVIAYYNFTYPSTADATGNLISGLPFTIANQEYANLIPNLALSSNANIVLAATSIKNTTTFLFRLASSGATQANSTLSLSKMTGTIIYPVA